MSNSLKLQVLLSAVDKMSTPLKSVTTQVQNMSKALLKSKEHLKSLEQQQKLINQFRQTKTAVIESNKALQEAKNKAQALAQQLNATAQPTQKMQKAFEKARNSVKKLEAEQIKHNQKLREIRSALDSSGINTKRLSQAQQELSHKMKLANQAIQSQENRLGKLNKKAKENVLYAKRVENLKNRSEQVGALGQRAMVQTYAIGSQLVKPVAQFMEFEDAMAGVARQVQGLKDDSGNFTAEYDVWVQKIQEMSKRLPMTTTDIANMVTAGARMEVPKALIEDFVELSTKMATAFDAQNVEEFAETFGKVQKNFKLTSEQGKELADVINYLDDSAISKGTDIIDFLNNTSGIAGIVDIDHKNLAALGSTLLTAGNEASTSAKAVESTFNRLAKAPDMKPVKKALSQLGLDAQKVQKGMVTDAEGTLLQVIERIKKLPKHLQAGVITGIAGGNYNTQMASLVSNTEEYRRQITLANSEEAKGSMDREFQTRMTTLSVKWQIFKNQLFNTNSILGKTLKETLIGAMDAISRILDKVNVWIKANPELTASIAKWAVTCTVAMGVFGLLASTLSFLIYPIARLGLALSKYIEPSRI